MKHEVLKILKKLAIEYVRLLCTFTLCILAAFTIPTSFIKNNVAESARQVQKEGLWFKPFGFYLFQIDNMTDCLMMNISVCADSGHPARAAMMAEFAQPYNNGDTRAYKDMAKTTSDVAEKGQNKYDKATETINYARYWHGYQTVLRPLLCFLNYNQIRILNYISLFTLLSVTIMLMCKALDKKYAMTFLVTLLISNIMIVPLAMQFSTCFYISLAAMLIFLAKPSLASDTYKPTMIFFAIGAVTSYMDFLTTPLLTLGFPLVVFTALNKNSEKIRNIMIQSMSWLAGYASLWVSKWIIGWIITGENIIESALGSAQLRIGDTIVFGGTEMSMSHFFDIILTKISSLTNPLYIIIAVCIITSLIVLYFYKNRKILKTECWLILIAIMPLLWFIVMKNHSLQHIFFTWRDWMLTLWCMLLFICHTHFKTEQL